MISKKWSLDKYIGEKLPQNGKLEKIFWEKAKHEDYMERTLLLQYVIRKQKQEVHTNEAINV